MTYGAQKITVRPRKTVISAGETAPSNRLLAWKHVRLPPKQSCTPRLHAPNCSAKLVRAGLAKCEDRDRSGDCGSAVSGSGLSAGGWGGDWKTRPIRATGPEQFKDFWQGERSPSALGIGRASVYRVWNWPYWRQASHVSGAERD